MPLTLPVDIDSIKGFLAQDEGETLYQLAAEVAKLGPVLEVGSYCGKSTLYLGSACKLHNNTLFAVDHHRGSEEHQPGEQYHDPELFDAGAGLMDSFRSLRHTLRSADLEQNVVPVVSPSEIAARHWQTPLGMVFIDGGHSEAAAQTDYQSWAKHVVSGGILAIHDIFPNPADGGQAPYNIWKRALNSGLFEALPTVNTLGILRRR
ncbi:class I SAM-dependent methyltransferase [Aestuariirhabdus sp. Z084]|uniref:class I SAM-dependent methyltransferase n=1 Tax=Aestuariirhabdus haliotis TaxID=2918751 RepID=UPI00201B3E22|nr:class I SAM-dependent methyltransferase [Aestuariirhabdus haliotis]MCL6416517.1 class I SAM-dependent methyltransferase [Aestuariirhabdus haliotis]MCL6420507.1 class I SAM-dependent methyltransferase [Aestuariirhabdus haliotis]